MEEDAPRKWTTFRPALPAIPRRLVRPRPEEISRDGFHPCFPFKGRPHEHIHGLPIRKSQVRILPGALRNRVGGGLTAPPSHTTGHTCSVPRRFLLTFNASYLPAKLMSPCSANQSSPMAWWATHVRDVRHQPLPESACIHAPNSFTPRLMKKRASVYARLHCFSRRHLSLRRIHWSRPTSCLLHRASWKYDSQPMQYEFSFRIRSSNGIGLLRFSRKRILALNRSRLAGAIVSQPPFRSR